MNTIFTQLHAGERYAGIVIDSITCKPTHHLILLPHEPSEPLNWQEAMEWAASLTGQLPSLQEAALLYANCKPAFNGFWYWTNTVYESVASYAWCQGFGNGNQYDSHKSHKLRACAIRRVLITEEHTQMSRFTEEQLKELETIFGLKREEEIIFGLNREEETLPVRDGVVTKDTLVWWRCVDGPEQLLAYTHWGNIKEFPNVYQLEKPTVAQIIYSD